MAVSRPKQTSPFFTFLVSDVRNQSYSYLPVTDLVFFALTSKSALDDIRKKTSLLQQMLHLAAFAKPVSPDQKIKSRLAVMRLLTLYPDLLFVEGQVKDPAGHIIVGSIYKIFLGAGDTCALKEVDEKIIPRITNGNAIADEQYKQQFPRHADKSLTEEERLYDDRNIAQIAQVKKDLNEIATAFAEDPCTGSRPTKQRTIDAFNSLQEHVAPKEVEVIRTGLHSPPKIMEMVFKTYDEHYEPWSIEQAKVYSLLAIGGTQKTATAVDAQCYKQWLVNNGENLAPDRNVSYFTSSGVPNGLGETFFVDVHLAQPWIIEARVAARWSTSRLANYVKHKSQHLARSSYDGNTREENTQVARLLIYR